jgi:hypothetical protein
MTDGLLGIIWHQILEFGSGLLMLQMCRSGPAEDCSVAFNGTR